MFDKLFKCPKTIDRHLNSPLLESRLSYLNYCAEQGTSKTTLRIFAQQLLVVIDYLKLGESEKEIAANEIESAANRWISRQPQHGSMKNSKGAKKSFISIATHWLHFLGRLSPSNKKLFPYSYMLEEFADYMNSERGFSKHTIHDRCKFAEEFLRRIYDKSCPFTEISITEIQEFITSKSTQDGCTRSTIRQYAYLLRAFFRFAEMRGWCKAGLASAIMSPCIFKQASLPVGPSWENVQHLIASVEGDNSICIRNRAILMLISIYGLRSSEVCNLRIDDIDWEKEQICIHRTKQGKTQIYPLSHTVGDAILRYLKAVRPHCKYREIFLTIDAPTKPLTNRGIHSMVSRYLHSLNIQTNHYGPHSLRHACASHLLAEGFSLKEIGDYLGHRSSEATRIYAKVDIIGLREVADFQLGGLL